MDLSRTSAPRFNLKFEVPSQPSSRVLYQFGTKLPSVMITSGAGKQLPALQALACAPLQPDTASPALQAPGSTAAPLGPAGSKFSVTTWLWAAPACRQLPASPLLTAPQGHAEAGAALVLLHSHGVGPPAQTGQPVSPSAGVSGTLVETTSSRRLSADPSTSCTMTRVRVKETLVASPPPYTPSPPHTPVLHRRLQTPNLRGWKPSCSLSLKTRELGTKV